MYIHRSKNLGALTNDAGPLRAKEEVKRETRLEPSRWVEEEEEEKKKKKRRRILHYLLLL